MSLAPTGAPGYLIRQLRYPQARLYITSPLVQAATLAFVQQELLNFLWPSSRTQADPCYMPLKQNGDKAP